MPCAIQEMAIRAVQPLLKEALAVLLQLQQLLPF
jgi:hypothetical protein